MAGDGIRTLAWASVRPRLPSREPTSVCCDLCDEMGGYERKGGREVFKEVFTENFHGKGVLPRSNDYLNDCDCDYDYHRRRKSKQRSKSHATFKRTHQTQPFGQVMRGRVHLRNSADCADICRFSSTTISV